MVISEVEPFWFDHPLKEVSDNFKHAEARYFSKIHEQRHRSLRLILPPMWGTVVFGCDGRQVRNMPRGMFLTRLYLRSAGTRRVFLACLPVVCKLTLRSSYVIAVHWLGEPVTA
jgi:hypothetical protein